MATPIDFIESNANYGKPKGWRDDQCSSLPAYEGKAKDEQSGAEYPIIISKWKFTPEELEELNRNNGEFFINMFTDVMMPVSIFVANPFAEQVHTVVNIAGKGCLLTSLKADFNDAEDKPDYHRGGTFEFMIPDRKVLDYLKDMMDTDIKRHLSYLSLNAQGESIDSGTLIGCIVTLLPLNKMVDRQPVCIRFDTIQSHKDGK